MMEHQRDPVKLVRRRAMQQKGVTLTNYEVAVLFAHLTHESAQRIDLEAELLTLKSRAINKESEDEV